MAGAPGSYKDDEYPLTMKITTFLSVLIPVTKFTTWCGTRSRASMKPRNDEVEAMNKVMPLM